MGLWDAIKGVGEDFRKQQERKQLKRAILDRFDMPSLKKISKDYGAGEPSKFNVDPFDGKKTRRTVTREHWIQQIMGELKLEQVQAFCEKNRIRIDDLVPSLARPPAAPAPPPAPTPVVIEVHATEPSTAPPQSREFDLILQDIEQKFEPEDIRSEEDFEKQLMQRLKILYQGGGAAGSNTQGQD